MSSLVEPSSGKEKSRYKPTNNQALPVSLIESRISVFSVMAPHTPPPSRNAGLGEGVSWPPYLNITSIPSVKLEVLPLQSLDQAWKFQVSPIMNVTF